MKNLEKNLKQLVFGIAALALAPSLAGANGGGMDIGRPVLEVAGGYDFQVVQNYTNCGGPCGGPAHSNDGSRSGGIIEIGITGLRLSDLLSGGTGKYDVRFIPLYMIMDTDSHATNSFGRVAGMDHSTAGPVKKFVGALVEGQWAPGDSIVNLRAKLVQADYDRDKGFWDWRALDASVGIRKAVANASGSVTFNIELDVGGGFGGVHLNGYNDIETALNLAPRMEGNAYTFDPYAAFRTGVRVGSFKMQWVTTGEYRVDLTPGSSRAQYQGTTLGVDSWHVVSALDAEFILGKHGFDSTRSRIGVFANAAYDFDTLTMSNMFFREGDAFQSFRLIAGVRGRF
jgi:hypothetical protein